MRVLCLVAFATVAEAGPVVRPSTQALTCPNGADTCELTITGKLASSRRDAAVKWDNLQIATVVDGKRTIVYASINIPHREQLKLKADASYRFTIAADKPFGAMDLWVTGATASR